MSQLDSDRQQIERLTDVVAPPSFAQSARAGSSEHTTTPWQLCHHLQSAEKDASCPCGYRGGIWGDDGELLVCEMRNCDLHEGHDMTPVGDRATQLANATFIVKAVNAHEAMIEALKDIRLEASKLGAASHAKIFDIATRAMRHGLYGENAGGDS